MVVCVFLTGMRITTGCVGKKGEAWRVFMLSEKRESACVGDVISNDVKANKPLCDHPATLT